jgi:hypothetical protein
LVLRISPICERNRAVFVRQENTTGCRATGGIDKRAVDRYVALVAAGSRAADSDIAAARRDQRIIERDVDETFDEDITAVAV